MPEATVQMNTSQRILHNGPTLVHTEIAPVQRKRREGEGSYSQLLLQLTILARATTTLFLISLNVLFLSSVGLVHTIRLNINCFTTPAIVFPR